MSFDDIINDDINDDNIKNTPKLKLRNEKPKTKVDTKVKKTNKSIITKKGKGKGIDDSEDESRDDSNLDNLDNLDDLAEKFQKKTQYQHIMDLPDTYIGSIIKENANLWIVDSDEKNDDKSDNNSDVKSNISIVNKEIEYVPGLRNIIEEILINGFDNMNRVIQKNAINTANGDKKRLKLVSYIKVCVDIESGQISIENDGEGIDVAIHPIENVYIPQMIFGELLTSGNYNSKEEKITGGKNGYGAKLTNIFSKKFIIETVDRHRKLMYTQEYRENMSIKCEPIVEKYKGEPYTRITFIPDYAKFKMTGMTESLSNLIKKRTIDMFACSRGQLNIFFNDEKIELKSFTDYMKLYLEPEHLTVANLMTAGKLVPV